jgi:hypothetical protein
MVSSRPHLLIGEVLVVGVADAPHGRGLGGGGARPLVLHRLLPQRLPADESYVVMPRLENSCAIAIAVSSDLLDPPAKLGDYPHDEIDKQNFDGMVHAQVGSSFDQQSKEP